ncbi:MAG: efflux RND transporter periplasmic adaptor subunit [Veillonella sp.]|nr:efflux RND transporter periplasmic adaptor subunit [Veillonella sp.]MBP9551098.1 efflux RND transporter periplasmic adaptor subunit [Veillonella sp.]
MHTNTTQTKTQYTTGKVEKGTVKTLISATGTINPVNYVDVSTNVAGKLESVLVKENDQVTEGQVIAYLDMRSMQATVDRAKSAMDNAEKDMNRYATLAAQDAIARQTYDTAVSTYEQAKATYDSAVANLSDATITAPMTGTIIGTPLKAGQTISTGISTQMVIATIADLSNLEIYLTVDETDIGNIRSGSKVDFTVDSQPGKTFTGYVSQIAKGTKGEMGTTSSSVVYYTVKVQIPSDIADNFLPTMTARATIYGDEQKDTLVVPMTAVRTDKQGEYVYVIKNGQPTRTSVSTGLTGDTNIQILNGVSEGDEIVVSGDVTTSNKSSGRMGLF